MSPRKGISIPESGKFLNMESGIMCFGIRNTAQGIRNPTDDLNSGIQNPRLSWIPLHGENIDGAQRFWKMQEIVHPRACLQEGGGPQVGEVNVASHPT